MSQVMMSENEEERKIQLEYFASMTITTSQNKSENPRNLQLEDRPQ